MDIAKYAAQLLEVALAITKHYHTAEDIVQDTYLEALITGVTNEEDLFELCRHTAQERRCTENNNVVKTISGRRGDDGEDHYDYLINKIPAHSSETSSVEEQINDLCLNGGLVSILTFDMARAFAINLGLRNSKEWYALYDKGKIPASIPRTVKTFYRKWWRGWEDFLGFQWLTFEDSRTFVITILVPKGINTLNKYTSFGRSGNLPKRIPLCPDTVYQREWKGWGYWFGGENSRIPTRTILRHDDAMEFVQNYLVPLGIDTLDKYIRYVDPPQCLPNALHHYYKGKGWVNSSHFFGTDKARIGVLKQCREYKEVREWCRLNLRPFGIIGRKTFKAYLKGEFPLAPKWPKDFPGNVENYFERRGTWVSYSDLLGNINFIRRSTAFWNFEHARNWAIRHLGHVEFITERSWNSYCRGVLPLYDLPEFPDKMPKAPDEYYKNEWLGWPHFFNRESQTGKGFITNALERSQRSKTVKRQLKVIEQAEIKLRNNGVNLKNKAIILQSDKQITGKMLRRILNIRAEAEEKYVRPKCLPTRTKNALSQK